MSVPLWAMNDELPSYQVNLDDPPETRWLHILKLHTKELKQVISESLFGRTRAEARTLAYLIEQSGMLDEDIKGELRWLEEVTGMERHLVLFHYFGYAFACVASLIKQPDGSILHVRNFD